MRTARQESRLQILKPVRIPTKLATALRESQTDREKFVRTSMLRLQQQQITAALKLRQIWLSGRKKLWCRDARDLAAHRRGNQIPHVRRDGLRAVAVRIAEHHQDISEVRIELELIH